MTNTFNITEAERVFSKAPFISDLGLQLVKISSGECQSHLKLQEKHLQQEGFVHPKKSIWTRLKVKQEVIEFSKKVKSCARISGLFVRKKK